LLRLPERFQQECAQVIKVPDQARALASWPRPAIRLKAPRRLGLPLRRAKQRVLDHLDRRTTNSWIRHGLVEHAPVVIVRAHSSDGKTAETAADNLMDYLGRECYVSLAAQVQQALRELDPDR
jgi:hypothetical protein